MTGDELLFPSRTFVRPLANSVLYVGSTAVFVDIYVAGSSFDVRWMRLKPSAPKTKAVIIVHVGAIWRIRCAWQSFLCRRDCS